MNTMNLVFRLGSPKYLIYVYANISKCQIPNILDKEKNKQVIFGSRTELLDEIDTIPTCLRRGKMLEYII